MPAGKGMTWQLTTQRPDRPPPGGRPWHRCLFTDDTV